MPALSHSSGRVCSLLLLAASVLLSAACTEPFGRGGRKVQVPWPDAHGHYSLQAVEVPTLTHPERLQGDVAQVLIDPRSANERIEGDVPVGRFAERPDGLLIPSDLLTLQAVTVYAHLERLFSLDRAAGVADIVPWPRTVAIHANVIDRRGAVENNALYDGRLDALIIVPYTGEQLPITMNAGVLAHEHFHAIFQHMVLARIEGYRNRHGEVESISGSDNIEIQEYNRFLLRSLNEGLADFWGWVYTGDSEFIGHSLHSKLARHRRIDDDFERFPTVDEFKRGFRRAGHPEVRIARAYTIGTNYARFMRAVATQIAGEDLSVEARQRAAATLTKALPALADSFAKAFSTEFISPAVILPALYSAIEFSDGICLLHKRAVPSDTGGVSPAGCGSGDVESAPGSDSENEPESEAPPENAEPGSRGGRGEGRGGRG